MLLAVALLFGAAAMGARAAFSTTISAGTPTSTLNRAGILACHHDEGFKFQQQGAMSQMVRYFECHADTGNFIRVVDAICVPDTIRKHT